MSRTNLSFIAAIAALLLGLPAAAFDFADVATRARQLAQSDYTPPSAELPRALRELDYDQYRDIRFKPEKALWRDRQRPFELQLFHPGLFFSTPVKLSLIEQGRARPLGFNPDLFDYGRNRLDPAALRGLGYAGFRVHFPLNNPGYKDELLVFQGASYFRALGKGQRYGLSARGLAVDTAAASGEEFPAFTEFWVETPAPRAKTLTIYALLDSRRVTGAYQFTLRPGTDTVMDVKARLFVRESGAKLGLAPLTSMFLRGSNQSRFDADYRPQVHDSEGLLIANRTGEWIWRPLVNPRRLLVTSFALTNPKGFGLMQRQRDFGRYEDLEARYDLRPSAWIEPRGHWGAGRVELVLIPTPDETNDNIVAYWVPQASPAPGQAVDLQYRVHWQLQQSPPPLSAAANDAGVARVLQTRHGHGYVKTPDATERLTVDFTAPPAPAKKKGKPGAEAPVVGALWLDDNAEVLEKQTFPNAVTGGWRMSFRYRRLDNDKPIEMRAWLKRGTAQVSETWSYIQPPE